MRSATEPFLQPLCTHTFFFFFFFLEIGSLNKLALTNSASLADQTAQGSLKKLGFFGTGEMAQWLSSQAAVPERALVDSQLPHGPGVILKASY